MSFSRSSRAANGLFRRLAVTPGAAATRAVPGLWIQVRTHREKRWFWFSFERQTRQTETRECAACAACTSQAIKRGPPPRLSTHGYHARRVLRSRNAPRHRHDPNTRSPSRDRATCQIFSLFHKCLVDISSTRHLKPPVMGKNLKKPRRECVCFRALVALVSQFTYLSVPPLRPANTPSTRPLPLLPSRAALPWSPRVPPLP
jgi:hypothetical protein